MNKLNFVFLLIIMSLFGCNKKVDFTINVADFGLKPNSKENAIPSIIKAIAECKKHPNAILKFEKGRYDFMIDPAHSREYFESNTTNDGKKNLAILIEDCTGLTLDGGGSDFIFHGAIQPITIDHSDNIKIQNINIDWDLPLTAQAKVLAATPKNIDLEFDVQQFPYSITYGKLVFTGENWKAEPTGFMEYVADKHLIAARTGDDGCIRGDWNKFRYEELKPGTVRLNGEFTRTPAIGNYLIETQQTRSCRNIYSGEQSGFVGKYQYLPLYWFGSFSSIQQKPELQQSEVHS